VNHTKDSVCKNKLIKNDLVQLHFFTKVFKNEEAYNSLISPRINESGKLNEWPEGFFDEWDYVLGQMFS